MDGTKLLMKFLVILNLKVVKKIRTGFTNYPPTKQ
jgi:hypothetical protein